MVGRAERGQKLRQCWRLSARKAKLLNCISERSGKAGTLFFYLRGPYPELFSSNAYIWWNGNYFFALSEVVTIPNGMPRVPALPELRS